MALALAGAGFATLVGGCGSTTSEAPASDAGPGGGDAASASDATTKDAAADAETTSDAGSTAKVGAIFVIHDAYEFVPASADGGSDASTDDAGPVTKASSRAGAYFVKREGPAAPTTPKTIGPCVVETFGASVKPIETALSAGTLTVSGGTRALTLTPTATKAYATESSSTLGLWTGGSTLTFRAEGADVPAFEASLVAPSKLTLTEPVPAAGSLALVKADGLHVAWTGSSSGRVVFYFDAATSNVAASATCSFDAAAGSGDIPAGAFADLPGSQGTFEFYVKNTTTTDAAGVSIVVTASSLLVAKRPNPAAGEQVTLGVVRFR
ncbi:MAG: hypothetical protein U0169_22925 [Polyangiaceae bacterium]